MNLTLQDAENFTLKLKKETIDKSNQTDIAICPPFVYLEALRRILKDSFIKVGAQNMFYEKDGAFTGEISPLMLRDIHVDMAIIGHSERRLHFNETDKSVNLKIKAAFNYNLIPVLCIGEDLKTRESNNAESWVKNQLNSAIIDLTEKQLQKLIVAYEPIWAIGTGKICNGPDADKIIKAIREEIKQKSSKETSEKTRILYGGSIKSANFKEHIQYPDIDGGLVGSSSLSYDEFYKIINLTNNVHEQLQSFPG